MATAQMDTVIGHLRRAVLRQDGAGRTDGQLLASFIDQNDEAAFEALVRRHGPMVFGVCRRIVGNHHDAEDAFQATFLVLARKASSVKPRERLANWLHGVALRTAMKAKTMTAKRRGREKQVTEMPELEAAQESQWRDVQPLLDQELNGLPENYRLPILLCDLEGKTIKEAAQQLGWPQGSLAGRLARGRKLLAKRLASRGVVLSAGSLAAVVSQNVASAGVPISLMSSTVKAAAIIAAEQATVAGVCPAKVVALTEGVLKSMMLTKLSKVAVTGLVVLCLCGIGIGGFQALSAQETKTTITTTTITTTTKDKTSISGRWTGYGVNSLGMQSPGEMVITEAPDGTLKGTWGAPMRLPIQSGERVTEDTFRWEGSEEDFTYVARCTVTGNTLVIHWTCDNPTDGKTPRHSGKIVMARQTAPKQVKRTEAAEEGEATTTTTTITKQSKTDPRLEGTWKLIEHENSGVKRTDLSFVMTFANGWVVMAGDEACGPGEGTFTTVVDPKENRHDLDVTWTKGGNKGKTCYYSYQIEGDKLHVVGHSQQHDQIRWITISSRAGSGVSHHVLQRVTPQTTAKRVKTTEAAEEEQEETTTTITTVTSKAPKTKVKDGLLPSDAVWVLKIGISTHLMRLQCVNNRITGYPADDPSGRYETTGRVLPGITPVVSWTNDHFDIKGYSASFHGKLVEKGRIVGTVYDTRGQSSPAEMTLQETK